jgi:hypothetical protein
MTVYFWRVAPYVCEGLRDEFACRVLVVLGHWVLSFRVGVLHTSRGLGRGGGYLARPAELLGGVFRLGSGCGVGMGWGVLSRLARSGRVFFVGLGGFRAGAAFWCRSIFFRRLGGKRERERARGRRAAWWFGVGAESARGGRRAGRGVWLANY